MVPHLQHMLASTSAANVSGLLCKHSPQTGLVFYTLHEGSCAGCLNPVTTGFTTLQKQRAKRRLKCVLTGVDTSCKTAFVMSLLAELVAKGHRTLIFSQSRVMLGILQAAIVEQSYAFRRIDGSISSAAERQVSSL